MTNGKLESEFHGRLQDTFEVIGIEPSLRLRTTVRLGHIAAPLVFCLSASPAPALRNGRISPNSGSIAKPKTSWRSRIKCTTAHLFDFIEASFTLDVSSRMFGEENQFVAALNDNFRRDGAPFQIFPGITREEPGRATSISYA